MLKKLTFDNFKNFKEKVVFDLESPYDYDFSGECIVGHCVSKAIVCGINGSGKSNLGLALMDIICHLTDNQKNNRGIISMCEKYMTASRHIFHLILP